MLSENDVFFNQPDNNSEAFFHLLLSIAGRSPEEVDTLLQVHRQARTNTSTQESIFKDKSGLMIYALPYIFTGLRDTPLYRPSLVYLWQQCAVEVRACRSLSTRHSPLFFADRRALHDRHDQDPAVAGIF
jgi:hypothetical protein